MAIPWKAMMILGALFSGLLMAPEVSAALKYAPGQLVVKYKESVSAAAFSYSLGRSSQPPAGMIAALQQRHAMKSSRRLFPELADPRAGVYNRSDLLRRQKLSGQVRAAAMAGGPDTYPNLHNIYLLNFEDRSLDMEKIAQEVRTDPNVEYAHPNYLLELAAVPSDPSYGTQWAHQHIASESGWDLNTGNTGVVIAVVDTGMDLDHPDLAANRWINPAESGANSCNAVDDDSNGYIDDIYGWNFVDHDLIADSYMNSICAVGGNTYTPAFLAADLLLRDNEPEDTFGHGSMVAGVAGAVGNNGVGIAGTAWHCKIMPLRVAATYNYVDLAPGWTGNPIYMLSGWIASGITYAANNGAAVINLSLVDNNWPGAVKDAIDAAYLRGAVVVAGAGNYCESIPTYPAAYSRVIGVAATDQFDQRAIWGAPVPPLNQGNGTNYGTWIQVAAPGTSIYSTSLSSGYGTSSGTSLSTAFVSGLAGLVKSHRPGFTNAEIMKVISSTTDNITSDQYIGTGKINVFRALQMSAVPVAEINTPAAEQTLAASLDIMGSAGGANFASYTLQYGQRFYPSSWTTIAAGVTTPVANGVLAHWDLSVVTDNMPYTLRLLVTDLAGNVSRSEVIVYVQKDVKPGWPKNLEEEDNTLNEIQLMGGGYGDSIVLGDIDGDDDQEIVVSYRRVISGPNWQHDLTAYHHDGTRVMGWPRYNLSEDSLSAATIGDLNATGVNQIMVSGYNWAYPSLPNSTTFFNIFSGNGSNAPGWPRQYTSVHQISPHAPSLGDIDNDGNLEFVLPSKHDSNSGAGAVGMVFVYRYDGSTLPGWPKEFSLNYPISYGSADDHLSHACLVDLNEDGHLDIVCGVGFYNEDRIMAWDYQGNTLTGWPVYVGDEFTAKPIAGDINNDGHMEVVATAGNTLYAWSRNGTPLFTRAMPSGVGQPVMANLDADAELEIVVYCNSHHVYAFDHTGTLIPGWPAAVATTFVGGERPAPILVDVDGNDGGRPEVVYAAGENENIYAWNGDGTVVPGWPKVVPAVSNLTPAVADLDNDGNAEIVLAYSGKVLNVWNLNVPYNPANPAWPMAWFNSNHTSTYLTDITPPTVSMTAPASGTTIQGSVALAATASDNAHLSGVRFQVDGVFVGDPLTGAGPSFTVAWSSLLTPNGSHTVTAVAWDLAGNRTISSPITITINNPDITAPTVAITSPVGGATVSGTVNVTADAQDTGIVATGVQGVQFRLDGAALGSADTVAPYTVAWNTSLGSQGSHVLSAQAWDGAGNSAVAASVSVNVVHATPTPTVTPTMTPTPTPAVMLGLGEVKVIGSTSGRGSVNPGRGETARIYFRGSGHGTFEIRIFNLAGEQVHQDQVAGVSEGMAEWRATDAAAGIYVVVVQGPGVKTRKKIAIVR